MQQVATGSERTGRVQLAPWPGRPVLTHGPARRHNLPRPSLRLRPVYAAAAAAAGALIFIALAGDVGSSDWQPPRISADQMARLLGLGVDQVTVIGHRQTSDSAIFDALDLPNVGSQIAIDTRAAQARVERLPWIATASVTRVLPDGLEIRVTERAPSVVWIRDGREWLVDRTGRVLGPNPPGARPELRRLAGHGAPEAAAALFEALAPYPALLAQLRLAERVSERRWTLYLAPGPTVLLPATGLAEALANLMAGRRGQRLVDRDRVTLDLRSPARIFVRATPG